MLSLDLVQKLYYPIQDIVIQFCKVGQVQDFTFILLLSYFTFILLALWYNCVVQVDPLVLHYHKEAEAELY